MHEKLIFGGLNMNNRNGNTVRPRLFLPGALLITALTVAATIPAGFGLAQNTAPSAGSPELTVIREPDIFYVPTPQAVVDSMLSMAKVTKADLIYDLGCGDGRIVVTGARTFGCRGVGYDIDPERVVESRKNVQANKVQDLVRIEQEDIFTLDLSGASVVTLYLLPSLNVKLIPQLEKLKPGTRIVSHDFDMQGVVEPDMAVEVVDEMGSYHDVYLWIAPLKRAAGK